jgi:hypothetical protein
MKPILILSILLTTLVRAAEPKILLEDSFTAPLSKDWHWGLGTWSSENGVLRGFESGERRHGPVKMRKLVFTDAVFEFEYRLEGKASFAGIVFNGSQQRGHLFHLYMTGDKLRLAAHPSKNEKAMLLEEAMTLPSKQWHKVRVEIRGETLTATVGGKTFTARHACIAEPKEVFGLGGDSGGPEGEKAGALNFRHLKATQLP